MTPETVQEKDVSRYFEKISDTVGILESLTDDKLGDTRRIFFEAVKQINFLVYEVDHKTEDLRHFDTWSDLRDLLSFIGTASVGAMKIDTLDFMRYFARQLSMYDVEHRLIHDMSPRPEAQRYVARFFDEGVEYVDTGYYYSLANENGLISSAAVRHGHNVSKALDVIDAVEDYEDDRVSNNYPPFMLYLLYNDSNGGSSGAGRPELSAIVEHGSEMIRSYQDALRADGDLLPAESVVFEQALESCERELRTAGQRES